MGPDKGEERGVGRRSLGSKASKLPASSCSESLARGEYTGKGVPAPEHSDGTGGLGTMGRIVFPSMLQLQFNRNGSGERASSNASSTRSDLGEAVSLQKERRNLQNNRGLSASCEGVVESESV